MKSSNNLVQQFSRALDHALAMAGRNKEQWSQQYASAHLSTKRARWDLVWNIPSLTRTALFDIAYNDEGLDDSHIDTILRAYFKA